MNLTHAAKNGVILLFRDQVNAGTLPVILAIMPHPGLPKNLLTKPTLKIFASVFKVVLSIGIVCPVLVVLEGMGRSAQTNHGSASI